MQTNLIDFELRLVTTLSRLSQVRILDLSYFFFFFFAALGLSYSMRDLQCGMQALSAAVCDLLAAACGI